MQPETGFIAALGGGRVLAFAGIGDPEKFFATLADAGDRGGGDGEAFPTIIAIRRRRRRPCARTPTAQGLVLVTTEKDLARLAGDDAVAQLAAHAHALPVTLVFEDEEALKSLLLERLAGSTDAGSPMSEGRPLLVPLRRRRSLAIREMPLQDRIGIDVGLLQIDAPVFQFLERDRQAGHCAAHERARPHDAKVAVEILDLGLARHGRRAIGSIQHILPPPQPACAGCDPKAGRRNAASGAHNIMARLRP